MNRHDSLSSTAIGRRSDTAVLVGGGAYAYVDAGRAVSEFWPVDATVVDAAVDPTARTDGDGSGRESFAAEITHEYVVERFPVGATATAYYDPANPASAYLLPERSYVSAIAVGIGAPLLAFGTRDALRWFGAPTGALSGPGGG